MATVYVSSLAGGGGDGSLGNPWTLTEAAANYNAGDDIRIMADGTYSIGATVTFAKNGNTINTTHICGATSSGVVDGTRPTLQATAGGITILSTSGLFCEAKYLILDGNSQTTVNGIVGGTATNVWGCRATGFDGVGIRAQLQSQIELCEADNCGVGLDAGAHTMFGNTAHSCTTGMKCGKATLCVSWNNSGNGFEISDNNVAGEAYFCVAHGNGGDGIQFVANSGSVINSILTSNGAYGIDVSAVDNSRVIRSAFYDNTLGTTDITARGQHELITLTADPFVDAANGDFTLNNDPGGGALCKAAAFGLLAVASNYDLGVVQSSGGGGGTPNLTRLLQRLSGASING